MYLLVLSVAHVEGNDGDPNVLGGLLVHVAQLEPGVILLLQFFIKET